MTNRVLYTVPWAAEALPEDIGDADSYIPSNPDYPEIQPNQYEEGWTVTPQTVVKQPHQWINSWLYGVDWQIGAMLIQNTSWQPEFNYPVGAIVLHEGVRWVAQTANIGITPIEGTDWKKAFFGTLTVQEAEDSIGGGAAAVNAHHADKNNPHDTTWEDFDGMPQSEIDAEAADLTSQLDAHLTDYLGHDITVEQLGTLHKDVGGAYSGQVTMLEWRQGVMTVRRIADHFEFYHNPTALEMGINITDRDTGFNGSEFLTDTNWQDMQMKHNSSFKAPIPDLHLALVCDVNAYSASGNEINYTSTTAISYTNKSGTASTAAIDEPAFNAAGLVLNGTPVVLIPETGEYESAEDLMAGQALTPTGAYSGGAGTVSAIVDGIVTVYLGPLNQTNLLAYFPSAVVSIKDIRVWNITLTPYQLAGLGLI